MEWIKRVLRHKVFIGFSAFFAFIAVFVFSFHFACRSYSVPFTPVNTVLDQKAAQAIEPYRRTEESTYLTFSEWYLVFDPQELATYLKQNQPSGFPYFRSIGQFWGSYCTNYGIANQYYAFNPGNHLMLFVIGFSYTVENTFKGVYGVTFGRLAEIASNHQQTDEDRFAAKVADEYGEFIPFRPFYEFPYGQKFIGLWKLPLFGDHLIRKWERRVVLSFEYVVKMLYGGFIRGATKLVYGAPDTEVQAIVTNIPKDAIDGTNVRLLEDLGEGRSLVALPHYQGFTDVTPGLAERGMKFVTIAGNDEILLTVKAPTAFQYNLPTGQVIFEQSLMVNPSFKRLAIQVPVVSLSEIITKLVSEGIIIEHLFDY